MDKPKSPPPSPPHATTRATANNRSLENIKSLLVKCAIASTPAKKSLTPLQKAFIEKRIPEIFPNIHTPDHPPYAWMIGNAIRQLNEEVGSTEESISKFIIEEHKDLPFAHASLLKHHLKKLSECDDLVQSHNGCYSIGKSSTLHNRTSEPNPTFTNTRSLVPVLSPSHSPSPDPSYSSSPAYESSSTYSSSESFTPKRKGRKKMKRKKSQSARGIKIHTKYNLGRARGRGRGSDSGCSKPEDTLTMMEVYVDRVEDDEVRVNHSEAIEIQYLTAGDEVADENIGNRDSVDVESRALESVMVIETEPPDHENRVDEERIEPLKQEKLVSGKNSSTPSTMRSSRGKNVASEQGSKNVRAHKRSIRSMRTPQSGRRRGRSRKRDLQMEKNNMANITEGIIEQVEGDDEDTLDELIEEVYMELKGETEIHNPTMKIRDQLEGDESEWIEIRDHAEGLQCKLNQQSDIIDLEQEHKSTDDDPNGQQLQECTFATPNGPKVVIEQKLLEEDRVNCTEEQNHAQIHELENEAASNGRVRLKGGEIEIIEEENHINKGLEVLEEHNRHIEQPELIPEQNQPEELHFVFVDRERKNSEEIEHCDELRKLENENGEGQNQQSEELTRLFSEQAVEKGDHHRPIEESRKMGIETLKMEDNTSKEVKSTVKPQSQQLRPRPPKFQQDQTEGQFGISTPEKSIETNQCRKLRPRPSKNESNKVANRAESLAARHAFHKRLM